MSQLDVYSAIFDEVIERDSEFGFLLKKIKQAYELAISSCLTCERKSGTLERDKLALNTKLVSLEGELSKSKEEVRAALAVKKENARLRKEVEALKSALRGEPKCAAVPKLHFGGFKGECFQDEFMEHVDDFSPSWRDALHKGR
jgi:hypothetical protein